MPAPTSSTDRAQREPERRQVLESAHGVPDVGRRSKFGLRRHSEQAEARQRLLHANQEERCGVPQSLRSRSSKLFIISSTVDKHEYFSNPRMVCDPSDHLDARLPS